MELGERQVLDHVTWVCYGNACSTARDAAVVMTFTFIHSHSYSFIFIRIHSHSFLFIQALLI